MQQVSLEELNGATRAAFIDALGDIFEHSPWVAKAAAGERPFPTLAALYNRLSAALLGAGAEQQLAVIKAHPDLAGKAARTGTLTLESTAEQASAGLDRLSEEEYATFHRLNEAYKTEIRLSIHSPACGATPGRSDPRSTGAPPQPTTSTPSADTVLGEILRIVALRLDQRVRALTACRCTDGSRPMCSTISPDVRREVAIELFELSKSDERRLVTRGMTNHDGRTDGPLISDRPIPIGRYELRFAVGAYYAALKAPQAHPSFLDIVPVRFAIAEPEGHYHVPLLCTPWSYTTYRGS